MLALVAVVIIFGCVAPLIDATRYSGAIHRAVEASLGRRIEFSKAHFTLFSGPGVSLDNVSISEDPRYGLEPFAYVPTLEAHLRIDKLLIGRMVLSSIRLIQPSLNLVKASDGTWNIVTLVQRLGAPRRAPLNFFPAFEVEQGRIDFKLGTRKTTFYVLDSDLTIYPARSGKLYIQFSGSPARTDRAGNGFGFLRGAATWNLHPADGRANQLDADVTLEPSNLSELTALIAGHDLGVHGTIGSRIHLTGPAMALNLSGQVRLEDVHRWDLLPSSGEQWGAQFRGEVDLTAHRLRLATLPLQTGEVNPVALAVELNNFLTRPVWSVEARLNHAPLDALLPLGRRMGLSLPAGLAMKGTLEGSVAYSSGTGVAGQVAIDDASATLQNVPPLHAQVVNASVLGDRIHFDPATIDTSTGRLEAGGDYFFAGPRVVANLGIEDFPADTLKSTVDAWFGMPAALAALSGGNITGSLVYAHDDASPASWSGEFQFANATLNPPGISGSLHDVQGRVAFNNSIFDLARFSGSVGRQLVRGNYRYSAGATHPERIHLEIPAAALEDIESTFEPTLEAQGLLARLRLSHRAIPGWLAARNMTGDLTIGQFSVDHMPLGPLSARFVWKGTNVQFTALRLNLPEGLIRASGAMSIKSYAPRYQFTASVTGFPWRGGLLSADGKFESAGMGMDSLQQLHAQGTFTGDDVTLSANDAFRKVAGEFEFSFANGWPDLRLSNVEASDGDEAWLGGASSRSDGKLIFDLEHEGRQRRVISTLLPENAATVSGVFDSPASWARKY